MVLAVNTSWLLSVREYASLHTLGGMKNKMGSLSGGRESTTEIARYL